MSAVTSLRALPTVKREPKREPKAETKVKRAAPRVRLATVLRCLLGGCAPVFSYTLAHVEVDWTGSWWTDVRSYFVFGLLIFSAKSVFQWAKVAFSKDGWKAFGITLGVEGVMICSHTQAITYTALALLVGVNCLAATKSR